MAVRTPAPTVPQPPAEPVLAAGCVVSAPGRRVLLVHRPKYDDWSFPKGKLDPGEHPAVAAVREVAEETGLDVRLGVPLPTQQYLTGPAGALRPKVVHYWAARTVGDDDVSGYRPNDEIDAVEWVPYAEALERLSYDHDRDLLEQWHEVRQRTRTLVVLRHAKAVGRGSWRGEDPARPLADRGGLQSEALVPLLAAYGVARVVTSPSVRCADTVAPYVSTSRCDAEERTVLSEEGADRAAVEALVAELLADDRRRTLLCTHRPVLPLVLESLGLPVEPLETAGMLVVHHRRPGRDRDGGGARVVAVEHHAV